MHWGDGPIPGAHVHPMLKAGRYPVACLKTQEKNPRIVAMRDWLLHESAEDGTGVAPPGQARRAG